MRWSLSLSLSAPQSNLGLTVQVRGQHRQRHHEDRGDDLVPLRLGRHLLVRRGDQVVLHQPRVHRPTR